MVGHFDLCNLCQRDILKPLLKVSVYSRSGNESLDWRIMIVSVFL